LIKILLNHIHLKRIFNRVQYSIENKVGENWVSFPYNSKK